MENNSELIKEQERDARIRLNASIDAILSDRDEIHGTLPYLRIYDLKIPGLQFEKGFIENHNLVIPEEISFHVIKEQNELGVKRSLMFERKPILFGLDTQTNVFGMFVIGEDSSEVFTITFTPPLTHMDNGVAFNAYIDEITTFQNFLDSAMFSTREDTNSDLG